MDDPKKREVRRQKREIKRVGGKRRRRLLKLDLAENPENAHATEPDLGRERSDRLNGLDRDATRQTKD